MLPGSDNSSKTDAKTSQHRHIIFSEEQEIQRIRHYEEVLLIPNVIDDPPQIKLTVLSLGDRAISVIRDFIEALWIQEVSARGLLLAIRGILRTPAGALTGTMVVIARESATNREIKDTKVGRTLRQEYLIVNTIFGLLAIPTIWSSYLLQACGQEKHVAEAIQRYMRMYLIGFPCFMILRANNQIVATLFNPKLAWIYTGIHTGITLGLGHILTYGELGFPEMQESGLGLAHATASIVSCAISTTHISCRRGFARYQISLCPTRKDFNWEEMKRLIKLATPSALQSILEFLTYIFINAWIGKNNEKDLGEMSIGTQVSLLAFVFSTAISRIAKALVKHYLILDEVHKAKKVGAKALYFNIIIVSSLCIGYIGFPRQISALLGASHKEQERANNILPLYGANQFFETLLFVIAGILSGYEDTIKPLFVSMARTVGIAGFALIGNLCFDLSNESLLIGMVGASAIAASTLYFYWKKTAIQAEEAEENAAGEISSHCKLLCCFGKRRRPHRAIGYGAVAPAEEPERTSSWWDCIGSFFSNAFCCCGRRRCGTINDPDEHLPLLVGHQNR